MGLQKALVEGFWGQKNGFLRELKRVFYVPNVTKENAIRIVIEYFEKKNISLNTDSVNGESESNELKILSVCLMPKKVLSEKISSITGWVWQGHIAKPGVFGSSIILLVDSETGAVLYSDI